MEIKQRVVQKAVAMLEATGARFYIVFDGVEYGEEFETPRRSKNHYAYGALSGHIKPYLIAMEVGDVCDIPVAEFDRPRIQSTACSIAFQMWGADSFTSMARDNSVQLMRLA